MNRRKIIITLLAAVMFLAIAGRVAAGTSASFDLSWHALTGGGGSRTSASYMVQDSLGQMAAGTSTGASSMIESGFWNRMGAIPDPGFFIFLPLLRH
jgi:hypothetical protein